MTPAFARADLWGSARPVNGPDENVVGADCDVTDRGGGGLEISSRGLCDVASTPIDLVSLPCEDAWLR